MNIPGFYLVCIDTQDLVSRILPHNIKEILYSCGVLKNEEIQTMFFERMSIDEARTLRSQVSLVMQKGIICVVVDRMPFDAQQSLLKILEELPRGISLYLCVSPDIEILPTILSRTVRKFFKKVVLPESTEITEQLLEKLHKKDPELYKKKIQELGHAILQTITFSKKMPQTSKEKTYQHVLTLIETVPVSRSAKIIGDFFLNVRRIF